MPSEESSDRLRSLIQAGYRYALSLTHHHYDAEDLVQQAWLKLTNRYGSVSNKAVLYSTIRNLFYDQRRRDKIVVFEPTDNHPEPVQAAGNPACGDLDVVLATLRSEEREVLYLNAVEGYTAREIAEQTGTPRNTVLSLIYRARQKLTRALGLEKKAHELHSERKELP